MVDLTTEISELDTKIQKGLGNVKTFLADAQNAKTIADAQFTNQPMRQTQLLIEKENTEKAKQAAIDVYNNAVNAIAKTKNIENEILTEIVNIKNNETNILKMLEDLETEKKKIVKDSTEIESIIDQLKTQRFEVFDATKERERREEFYQGAITRKANYTGTDETQKKELKDDLATRGEELTEAMGAESSAKKNYEKLKESADTKITNTMIKDTFGESLKKRYEALKATIESTQKIIDNSVLLDRTSIVKYLNKLLNATLLTLNLVPGLEDEYLTISNIYTVSSRNADFYKNAKTFENDAKTNLTDVEDIKLRLKNFDDKAKKYYEALKTKKVSVFNGTSKIDITDKIKLSADALSKLGAETLTNLNNVAPTLATISANLTGSINNSFDIPQTLEPAGAYTPPSAKQPVQRTVRPLFSKCAPVCAAYAHTRLGIDHFPKLLSSMKESDKYFTLPGSIVYGVCEKESQKMKTKDDMGVPSGKSLQSQVYVPADFSDTNKFKRADEKFVPLGVCTDFAEDPTVIKLHSDVMARISVAVKGLVSISVDETTKNSIHIGDTLYLPRLDASADLLSGSYRTSTQAHIMAPQNYNASENEKKNIPIGVVYGIGPAGEDSVTVLLY